MEISATPTVREANFEDREAVRSLQKRAGYSVAPRDNWPWLWTDNPVWARTDPKPKIGWVLDAEGEIVGYLGNIPILCRYGEKTLVAVASSGFTVDLGYRGYGLLLSAAFFKQSGVDIFLNTSANEVVAKINQRFKAVPLPQKDYDKILFWILRPQPFIAAALRSVGFNSTLAWFASNVSAPILYTDIAIRNRKPQREKSGLQTPEEIRFIDISEIGPEFDDLWSRKIKEESRLLSYRTAEVLRWHFTGQRAKVVCC